MVNAAPIVGPFRGHWGIWETSQRTALPGDRNREQTNPNTPLSMQTEGLHPAVFCSQSPPCLTGAFLMLQTHSAPYRASHSGGL